MVRWHGLRYGSLVGIITFAVVVCGHIRHEKKRSQRHFLKEGVALGLFYEAEDLGPWGPWSESSECSRTCGGGVACQTRSCDNITRSIARPCVGPHKRYFSCNIQDCPEGSRDFREEQCTSFDNMPFDGKFYKWVPYIKGTNKCELNCMPQGGRFYYRHSNAVTDGTRCREDATDICVEGLCTPVGCDMMLGSEIKEDKCRECAGNGTNCKTVEGIFDSTNLKIGYNDIILIPAGAMSIKIEELGPTSNYIAIRNLAGQYYLNGNWRIEFPRPLKFAGTSFHYDRVSSGHLCLESIKAFGPTTEPIFISLLYQQKNLGVSYEYSVPHFVSSTKPDSYTWVFSAFGSCSRTCAGGVQYRTVNCTTEYGPKVVANHLCDHASKPPEKEVCNIHPCPARWIVTEWDQCSKTCGNGTKYRQVNCQQHIEGNAIAVAPDDKCLENDGPKPSYVQSCNYAPCPVWVTGHWSTCDQMCGDGHQSREVKCQMQFQGTGKTIDHLLCDNSSMPPHSQPCFMRPCEGIEWIVSEWSGCDNVCGLTRESRSVFCAGENGNIHPPDMCSGKNSPELTRPCLSILKCEAMWHASEWSECSVKCDSGVRTRHVFCGVRNSDRVREVSETECDPRKKMAAVDKCKKDPCQYTWFTSPWTHCSVPCGGGHQTRKVLCLSNDTITADSYCNAASRPFDKELCNMHACDEDEVIMIVGCHKSKHGCCPDGITASGPDFAECPDNQAEADCENSEFGCCLDGVTAALGPFEKGCQKTRKCKETKHGCCPDGVTVAKDDSYEGCPTQCADSTWGCCPDGQTAASGNNFEGCVESSSNCHSTSHGCCPDHITPASGPDYEGCDIDISSGEDCNYAVFGCCPDGMTPALDQNFKGCFEPIIPKNFHVSDCSLSQYGCCPDGITTSLGPEFQGCDVFEGSGEPESYCQNTLFGCCRDGITTAKGPHYSGCHEIVTSSVESVATTSKPSSNEEDMHELLCSISIFGCCPDGITHATGPNRTGCTQEENFIEDKCIDTVFGCCSDGKTAALGPDEYGCCFASQFGCCPDNYTVAKGEDHIGCSCETFQYGCCLDGITPSKGPNFYGCTCQHSLHGCCQDNFTLSKGPHYEDCDCHTMLYGCCSDDVTPATGHDNKGCDCSNLLHGCCPDGRSSSLGPNFHGCSCETFSYGCCPDGRSVATGPNNEGCPCYSLPFGCCPDYKTAAEGPSYEGCSCFTMPHGCCSDNKTLSTGPNNQGCPCYTLTYGCCPDEHTSASGPNFQGCSCHTMPHKCCPDGKMSAKGTNYEGCPCTSFPYGCCPDGITVAQDRQLGGCQLPENESHAVTADVCSMPKERGPCHNYNVKWYFDMTYGGCSRFWYGGCEGNGNQFESQEKCEKICVEPEGEDACLLPKVVGPCKGAYQSWYYNANSDACESFVYSGCLGNNNRYESKELCERTCILNGFQDPCEQPAVSGSCKKSYQRWYFSKSEGACKPFIYGGCKGNENNFETEKKCLQMCDLFKKKDFDKCQQPQEIGSCYYFRERWFYDTNEGQCQRFYYSGCGGNDNNFASLAECEKECRKTALSEIPAEEFRIEHCFFNHDAGSCNGKITMWYYGKDGVCRQFYYGGCGGNGNRFHSKKECESKCGPSQDVCKLPKVRGPCSGSFVQWHYDDHDDRCHEFHYSGCQGNGNRFNDKETCELQCKTQTVKSESLKTDICSEPKDTGPCLGYFLVWYYDGSDGMCKSFVYGGCKGNRNRFETLNDCVANCHRGGIANIRQGKDLARSPVSLASFMSNEDVCRQPVDEGHCKDPQNKWYYDSHRLICQPFLYMGCGGNKNRFKSNELCMRFCAGVQGLPQDDSSEERDPVQMTTCSTSNCAHLQCSYGMEEIKDFKGCISCLCSNPCEVHNCPEGTQCALEDNGKRNGDHLWQPVCRQKSKEGRCPSKSSMDHHASEMCHDRCQNDADCPKDLKCCFVSCSFLCILPNFTENGDKNNENGAKAVILKPLHVPDIRKDVRVKTGSPILLSCMMKGNPFPEVKWYRNNVWLASDNREYKISLDGSLHIISAHQADKGTYSCVTKDSVGMPVIRFFAVTVYDDLVVNMTLVTKKYKLGSALHLDCVATGSTPIKITWHLGHNSNPLEDDDHRQILSNNTLFIASAQYNDSGLYICEAQNEESQAFSSIAIHVYDIPIPPSCVDSPNFTSCSTIVKEQYCINPSYAKFCCFSCAISGQLQRIPESIS